MISVIIAAFKEPLSISKAIQAFLDEKIKNLEIIVVAPDDETLFAARKFRQVKIVRDLRKGKPAALNLAFQQVRKSSKLLVLSDGDVVVEKGAVNRLVKHFRDPKVGAVSGHPYSLSSRASLLGYASHNFTDWWDWMRRKNTSGLLICSGYLFALRVGIIRRIPEDALSDDALMSYEVFKKGWKIMYEPAARVAVKYPDSFADWLKQKRRSAGGYLQTKKYFSDLPETRSFFLEAWHASLWVLRYPKSLKECCYTLVLFVLRVWLWLLIYYDRLKKKDLLQVWQPVESTK
ncbi:MAG: glycosyltransferase [Nanoarchaeota archaeon]|nr:glycosyltransferase [Nanoarchaeota archaeon]